MNITIDTLALQKGELLYNQGKFGNAPGWGQIIQVKEATKNYPKRYVVDMGEEYPDKLHRVTEIAHYTLKPGVGQLFITPQQYELLRQEANMRLHERQKLFNRQPQA